MKDQLLDCIIESIQDKKGKEIITIDLRTLNNSIADFFVVCHGDSNTQVEAITDSVETMVRKHLNIRTLRKEGTENAQWILLDYGYILVHVFQKNIRSFYSLEELWADAKITKIESY